MHDQPLGLGIHVVAQHRLASQPLSLTSGGGHLVVYGPFNYAGDFTSESNARFDAMLKANYPDSGIKDFEWLDTLAQAAGMALVTDVEMPANNRSLIWKKRTL